MITTSSLVKLVDQSIASVGWDLTSFSFLFFFLSKKLLNRTYIIIIIIIIIMIEQFRWLVVRREKDGGRGFILTRFLAPLISNQNEKYLYFKKHCPTPSIFRIIIVMNIVIKW